MLKKLGPCQVQGNATMIFTCQWDHDAVMRELTFNPSLLDTFTIDSVSFSHRCMTDDELRRVRKLSQMGVFVMDRAGPRANAARGRHNIIDASKTYAWMLSDEDRVQDPESACKRAMSTGRLALDGTCVAQLFFTVIVTNRTSVPETFEAEVRADD